MNNYNVDIVISNGNGKVISSQPFDEFEYSTKDIEIQKVIYGKPILGVVFQSDINRTAMQLLLGIAIEIVLLIKDTFPLHVKREHGKKADKFFALGTGLMIIAN